MGHDGADGGGAVFVRSFDMPSGRRFERHRHARHQLAWAATGVLTVDIGSGSWLLPPTRALWIPADVAHTTRAAEHAVMHSCYLSPAEAPVSWSDPTVVAVAPLLRHLILHLAPDTPLSPSARQRAEAVVFDLLAPMPSATIDVAFPVDPRGREVAEALAADPSDRRSLEEWGRAVGASSRTLTRIFRAELGKGFEAWRTHLRMRAALALLAAGTPVSAVSRRVGYRQPSAFVAAFRQVTGHTPGSYLR